jgi:hypothetical protein
LIIAGHDFFSFINFFIYSIAHSCFHLPCCRRLSNGNGKSKNVSTQTIFRKTQPSHQKTHDTSNSDACLYFLARIQACPCASFLFLLLFRFWLSWVSGIPSGCAEYPWEWRFEGLVHFQVKNRFFCWVFLIIFSISARFFFCDCKDQNERD